MNYQRITNRQPAPLIAANIEVLKQGIDLLARLDDGLYTQAIRRLSLSSVGGHLRHCIDFYSNFLGGLRPGQALIRIDYDNRERDERIEKSRIFAASRLNTLITGLGRMIVVNDHQMCEVRLESTFGSHEDDWSRSSLKRELQFLLSHTIHHYALIAVALRAQGFEPGADFGVAPSTREKTRENAKHVKSSS